MLLVLYPSQRRQRKYNILQCNYILFCESSKHEKWKFVIVQKNLSSAVHSLYTCNLCFFPPLELDERRRRHQVIMWDWHESGFRDFYRVILLSLLACVWIYFPRDTVPFSPALHFPISVAGQKKIRNSGVAIESSPLPDFCDFLSNKTS